MGSIALILHIAQLVAQVENTWVALTQFAIFEPFNVFLYEGLETLFTVFIVTIVQIHFSRIVFAFMRNKSRWIFFASLSCSVTCLAGLSTSCIILIALSRGRLKQDTPAQLSVQLTGCWAAWLGSAATFDITLLSILTNRIHKRRAGAVQVAFKTLLSRIMLIAIYAFLMTSFTSLVAVILIFVSTISSSEDYLLLSRLRIAAFVSNSFLPRIYLLAFCELMRLA